MKALFLCNKSPWPPREGGPMAMNMFVEGLSARGHPVRVMAVNSFKYNVLPGDIPEDYRRRTHIELIDVDLHIKPLAAFLNLFTRRSYHVERFISEAFTHRLTEILCEEQFDIIQLETLFMAPYIPIIRRHSRGRIILRAHNIEHRIWERIAQETRNPLKKWYLGHLACTLRKFEEETVGKVDGIVAITPTDADYFRGIAEQSANQRRERHMETGTGNPAPVPVVDIPFGLDPAVYDASPPPPGLPVLFSIGAMDWLPNQQGIGWFLEKVWPSLHRTYPQLTYHLAGRNMPGWMRSLRIPGVTVAGEVPDARAFMAGKPVMIVPLFSGSGIRIKIIEGMAAGKTIISTSMGAEGIRFTPGVEILTADEPQAFIDLVTRCVEEPGFTAAIGCKARQLAENEYDASRLVERLTAFYKGLGE